MSEDVRQVYESARKKGLKVYNNRKLNGRNPYLPFLDSIIDNESIMSEVQLGMMEIPVNKVKGTKTSGRATSFAPNFMPILAVKTEFASKWMSLYRSHIQEGIRDAVKVYEYLNYYYIEEGNKRISVLKYSDAMLINAEVTRLVPRYDENDETVVIYYEFMEFYKKTNINYVWMSEPDGFKKLYKVMKNYNWSKDLKEFSAVYYRFRRIYKGLGGSELELTTGDAFLRYLEVYRYSESKTNSQIQEELERMWSEFKIIGVEESITLEVDSEDLEKRNFLDGLTSFSSTMKHVTIGFIHSKDSKTSAWTYGHELGRKHLENEFGQSVTTKAYFNVPENEKAYDTIVKAVREGCQVIFTTSPTFINPTLKAAVEFKDVKFLNCSENLMSNNVRTYFGRIHEANFLVGIVAGAMTKSNMIGHVVTYPIPEVISSINAFTLGARFVNPFATVMVKWVTEGNTVDDTYSIDQQLVDMGVDIISHQESLNIESKVTNSGIYYADKEGTQNYLATPVWNWGKFYSKIVKNIMNGSYNKLSSVLGQSDKAISYWWGMDTEVVDILYSNSNLPSSLIQTVNYMRQMIIGGVYHPFSGPIKDQHGQTKVTEGMLLESRDIMTMDWFVEGVIGRIPTIKLDNHGHPLLELLGVNKKY